MSHNSKRCRCQKQQLVCSQCNAVHRRSYTLNMSACLYISMSVLFFSSRLSMYFSPYCNSAFVRCIFCVRLSCDYATNHPLGTTVAARSLSFDVYICEICLYAIFATSMTNYHDTFVRRLKFAMSHYLYAPVCRYFYERKVL